jgi:hypothetical protein
MYTELAECGVVGACTLVLGPVDGNFGVGGFGLALKLSGFRLREHCFIFEACRPLERSCGG